jgi:hypothetical protein
VKVVVYYGEDVLSLPPLPPLSPPPPSSSSRSLSLSLSLSLFSRSSSRA